jgi:homoserine dehydrogenase
MEPLGVALIGCGTVGSGVARLLCEQRDRLAARAGRPLQLRRVVVRRPDHPRAYQPSRELTTTELSHVYHDPAVHVGVEVMGGVDQARRVILDLLAAGKDVVTANKAVLSLHGDDIFAAAHAAGRTVVFEASVAGGIPIVHAVTQGLAANQIDSIKAILNGTSNYILTQMSERGLSYAGALADAQTRGFAEADPTLDVDGTDAAHKLAILARLAFGVSLPGTAIERRGIDDIDPADLRYAEELGYVIKLIAEAWLSDRRVALHVEPTLVRRYEPLAEVRGPYNAVHVVGDAVQDTFYYGPGAGQMPTASAVVADLVDLAIGRAQLSFRASRLWDPNRDITLRSADDIQSRFYLRINVQDRLGVLASIDGVLARHQVSIASVVQHERAEGPGVAVVLLTHNANLGAVRQAVGQIDSLPCSTAATVYYPVAE